MPGTLAVFNTNAGIALACCCGVILVFNYHCNFVYLCLFDRLNNVAGYVF